MTVKRQYIDTKYGQQHLRVAGNKTSKPTVICLHMMPKSGRTFTPLMSELANDRLVIAPDYPGYGESDPFPEDMEPQIADYADSIVEVINAFGLDSVHLLGYHTGSMVAVYLAQQLGPQVERLINVSAPILTDQEVVDFKQYFAPIPLDEAGTRFKIMWEKVIKFRGPEMTLEMAAVSMAENLRGGERYEDGHYAAFNYSQQYAQTIAELAQPLLVVNPGDDLQQHTLRVDEYLQNGHRVEHPEWGHGFLETSSADFASLVKDFLIKMSNPLKQVMPEMLEHEGVWEGNYQHLDIDGNIIDEHASRVECVFPEQGDVVYIQKNTFTWSDGRIATNEFGGILEGDRLFWDTDTFRGYGWVASPNMLLLDLDRKDDIGSSFYEVIIMGANKQNRARTWHWFKDGQCYRRTLCNERLSQNNSLLA